MKAVRVRKKIPYLWMSFANSKGFLGVVVLRARSMEEGVRRATILGINPAINDGDEGAGFEMPEEFNPPAAAVAKLLDRERLREYFGVDPDFQAMNTVTGKPA